MSGGDGVRFTVGPLGIESSFDGADSRPWLLTVAALRLESSAGPGRNSWKCCVATVNETRERLRAVMPAAERFAYLDHAAMSPLPRPTAEAFEKWLDRGRGDWQPGLGATG